MYASTSITSPAKNSPPIFFDIIVFGESSATDTPPEVTIASSIGRNDRGVSVKCFITLPSAALSSFVICAHFLYGSTPLRLTTSAIIDEGRSAPREFISAFAGLSKRSESIRLSSVAVERAFHIDLRRIRSGIGAHMSGRGKREEVRRCRSE